MNLRVVIYVLSVVISLSLITASTSKTSSIVPLLLWSSNSYFGDTHSTIQQTVTETEFHKLMTDIVNSHGHKKLLDGSVSITQTKPEVIVAFVYDHLSSGEVAVESGSYAHNTLNQQSSYPLSNIKRTLSESQSSLSIPYLLMEKMSTSLVNVISLKPNSKTIATYMENKKGSVSGCDALLTELQEAEEINLFNNGITDLVLLHYHHQKDTENCMSRVLSLVAEKSQNSYMALLSADSSQYPVQMVFGDHTPVTETTLVQIQPTLFVSYNTSSSSSQIAAGYPGVLLANSSSMFAVLLSLFLIFVLFMGVSCVTSIESPPRFPAPYQTLPVSKEY